MLPEGAVAVMKEWMFSPEHVDHPYPDEMEKQQLAEAAGITKVQLSNWFVNARKRLWQPYMRKKKDEEKEKLEVCGVLGSSSGSSGGNSDSEGDSDIVGV